MPPQEFDNNLKETEFQNQQHDLPPYLSILWCLLQACSLSGNLILNMNAMSHRIVPVLRGEKQRRELLQHSHANCCTCVHYNQTDLFQPHLKHCTFVQKFKHHSNQADVTIPCLELLSVKEFQNIKLSYAVDSCGDSFLILRLRFCITSRIMAFFCNLNWTASSVVTGGFPFRMTSSSIILVWKCWSAMAQSARTVRSAEASTVWPKGASASRDIKILRS
jgi:hypothetical protein